MTGDGRREVAASLRASADAGGARALGRELAKALGIQPDGYTPGGPHTEILRGLADLIDRPTCRNDGDRDVRGFWCSACGYGAWAYDDSGCDPSGFSFCPDCGAEVIDDDWL